MEWADTSPPMWAGDGSYQVAWTPGFRFPGQWEDPDGSMGTAANNRSFMVQNHYREYLPRFGRYNRVDPLLKTPHTVPYIYSNNSPVMYVDLEGLEVKECVKGWRNTRHNYICVNSDCYGFYPDCSTILFCPGRIDSGEKGGECANIDVPECCEKDEWESNLKSCIDISQKNPPFYNVVSYNCYHWVDSMLSCAKSACR